MDIRGLCIAGVVLQALVFGLGSAITKLAYESISPWWCLTIRFGLAALAFGVLFAPRIVAGLRAVQVRDWLPAALCMAVSYISWRWTSPAPRTWGSSWRCPWCSRR